jgi:hypothetical protein
MTRKRRRSLAEKAMAMKMKSYSLKHSHSQMRSLGEHPGKLERIHLMRVSTMTKASSPRRPDQSTTKRLLVKPLTLQLDTAVL